MSHVRAKKIPRGNEVLLGCMNWEEDLCLVFAIFHGNGTTKSVISFVCFQK